MSLVTSAVVQKHGGEESSFWTTGGKGWIASE